jgi:hypothetical protein
MKVFILLIVSSLSLFAAKPIIERKSIEIAGQVFTDAKLVLSEPLKVSVKDQNGIRRFPVTDFDAATLKELGFDPESQEVLLARFPLSVVCQGVKLQADGKFLWFFLVSNPQKNAYTGGFKISLINQTDPPYIKSETFLLNEGDSLGAGVHRSVSILAHNGPANVHGEYGFVKFRTEPTDSQGATTGRSSTSDLPVKVLP